MTLLLVREYNLWGMIRGLGEMVTGQNAILDICAFYCFKSCMEKNVRIFFLIQRNIRSKGHD